MALLLPIAFAAGLITAFTPCILPVLPIILSGGASGGKRRPYAIVAGLVTTFTLFTLAGAWIFHQLHLSASWQARIGVATLVLLALTLVLPRIGTRLERPFLFLTRVRTDDVGSGFLLGASLGLVFVPCAGPIFGAVSTNVGSHRIDFSTVAVALAYAAGAAVPMLFVAAGGRRAALRLRAYAQPFRISMAALMAAAAVVILGASEHWRGFVWETRLQTAVPGYADSLQRWIEGNSAAKSRLRDLGHGGEAIAAEMPKLDDFGPAPGLERISGWINSQPLTMQELRGKVVLIDFWTYSCINCLRTLPHLEAWDAAYRKDGLVIVGVHTPEFAFEHVPSNVRKAVAQLGVRYPVALDNDYGTWNAYGNQYWPADYLIDRRGHVRSVHFGEGAYDETEMGIRALLAEPGVRLGSLTSMPDTTPRDRTTPETYLGYERIDRYAGPRRILPDRQAFYRLPQALPQNGIAYGGFWRIEGERSIAGRGARLRLHFYARHVFLVLGGEGRVQVLVNGRLRRTIRVGGIGRLHTLLRYRELQDALLELRFTPGVAGYAFTFG